MDNSTVFTKQLLLQQLLLQQQQQQQQQQQMSRAKPVKPSRHFALTELPRQLIDYLLLFLNQRDQARLCLTSKWMLMLARRQLYRRLTLIDYPSTSPDHPDPVMAPAVNSSQQVNFMYDFCSDSRTKYFPTNPNRQLLIPQHPYYYDRYTEQLTIEIKDTWNHFHHRRNANPPAFNEIKTPWRSLRKLVIVCNSWYYASNIWAAIDAVIASEKITERITHLKLNIHIPQHAALELSRLINTFINLDLFEFRHIGGDNIYWLAHEEWRQETIVKYLLIRPKRVKFWLGAGFSGATMDLLREFVKYGKLVEFMHDPGIVFSRSSYDLLWYKLMLQDVINAPSVIMKQNERAQRKAAKKVAKQRKKQKFIQKQQQRQKQQQQQQQQQMMEVDDGNDTTKHKKKSSVVTSVPPLELEIPPLPPPSLPPAMKPNVATISLRSLSLPLVALCDGLIIEQIDLLRPYLESLDFFIPWPIIRRNSNKFTNPQAPNLVFMSKWPRLRSLGIATLSPQIALRCHTFVNHIAPQLLRFSVSMEQVWLRFFLALLLSLKRATEVTFVLEDESQLDTMGRFFLQCLEISTRRNIPILPMVRKLTVVTYIDVSIDLIPTLRGRLEQVFNGRNVELDVRSDTRMRPSS
ncbi:hypothetical protein GQ42DRAFT_165678 [Ramicandelaber brevisporus]|nr:hypothetical protein GQ42DRAFT_165678 [Ramicandelaber brevisporus]